jgi:target of rapamycin complex subunit LST8
MGSDGLIKNWSIDSQNNSINLSSTLSGHNNWVWDAAFSADSSFILTGSSDNTARLWDMAAGEVISIYSGHSKAITAVAMNDSII